MDRLDFVAVRFEKRNPSTRRLSPMFKLFQMIIFLMILQLPLPLMACGPGVRIVKKPEGLRNENPDPSNPFLNAEDRLKWKSVLNWCDECDERSRLYLERFGEDDGTDGGIFIYPIGANQYLVDIQCRMTMHQREHIYYKVTEHTDTIESRLLILEQYNYLFAEGSLTYGVEEPKNDPQGEFVRFKDSLAYGITFPPEKTAPVLTVERRYRAMGGCGLHTVYDVSGDCPKVIEFRAKLFCSPETPMPDQWKLYTAKQRAKWRVVTNPQREDWKPSATPACSK
jgi:hypothetical protein